MMFLRVLLLVIVGLAGSAVDVRAQVQSPPASPPKASPQALSIPSPETMLVMVRAALIALDQANKTGNYTVMHGMGGPQLQQNTPAKIGDMFAALRQSGADLQPVLVLTPLITQTPVITPEGLLLLVGYFPSQPLQIKFEVAYQAVAGFWKLAGLNTTLVSAVIEAAPAAAPPAAAAPSASSASPAPSQPKAPPAQPKAK